MASQSPTSKKSPDQPSTSTATVFPISKSTGQPQQLSEGINLISKGIGIIHQTLDAKENKTAQEKQLIKAAQHFTEVAKPFQPIAVKPHKTESDYGYYIPCMFDSIIETALQLWNRYSIYPFSPSDAMQELQVVPIGSSTKIDMSSQPAWLAGQKKRYELLAKNHLIYARHRMNQKIAPSCLDLIKLAKSQTPPRNCEGIPKLHVKKQQRFEGIVFIAQLNPKTEAAHHKLQTDDFIREAYEEMVRRICFGLLFIPAEVICCLKAIPAVDERSTDAQMQTYELVEDIKGTAAQNGEQKNEYVQRVCKLVSKYNVGIFGLVNDFAQLLDRIPAVFWTPAFNLPKEAIEDLPTGISSCDYAAANFQIAKQVEAYQEDDLYVDLDVVSKMQDIDVPKIWLPKTMHKPIWNDIVVMDATFSKLQDLIIKTGKQFNLKTDVTKEQYKNFLDKHCDSRQIVCIPPQVISAQVQMKQFKDKDDAMPSVTMETEEDQLYNQELIKLTITIRNRKIVPEEVMQAAEKYFLERIRPSDRRLDKITKQYRIERPLELINTVATAINFIPYIPGKQCQKTHWKELENINEKILMLSKTK